MSNIERKERTLCYQPTSSQIWTNS